MKTVAIAFCLFIFGGLGYFIFSSPQLTSDEEVKQILKQHQESLIRITEELRKKTNILRIAEDHIYVKDVGNLYKEKQAYLDLEHWDSLIKDLHSFGFSGGVTINHGSRFQVTYIIDTSGMVTGSKFKGLLYSDKPVGSLVKSLDSFKHDSPSGKKYVKLDDKWYVILSWGG